MAIKKIIERLFGISEVATLTLKAIAGLGALSFAFYGAWSMIGDINPRITEGAKELVGIDVKRPRIVKLLASLAYKTNASRAFVIRYVSESDQLYSDFTQRWQWTQDGLTPIPYNLYPVWTGRSLERYHRHSLGQCVRYVTDEMGNDKLRQSFAISRTAAHISCGGTQPPPGSRRGTFAVAVEFSDDNPDVQWRQMNKSERELRQTEIEIELLAAGGAIAEIIDR